MSNTILVDVGLDGVAIESDWRHEKPSGSIQTQTQELHVTDSSTQSTTMREFECQTDLVANSVAGEGPGFEQFLRTASLRVEEQLVANIKSQAFNGYEPQWEEVRQGVTHLHTLKQKPEKSSAAEAVDAGNSGVDDVLLAATSISWNATGQSLAVSFGSNTHTDLCHHQSNVRIWNLSRKFVKEDAADLTLESQVCIQSLAFHPTNPALLAAGTFNGGVMIWDISKGNVDPVASNVLTKHSHKEPVVQVSWMMNPLERNHILISVAGDGRVLFWSVALSGVNHGIDVPIAALDLASARSGLTGGVIATTKGSLGASALGVASQIPGSFVAGTEGGALLMCHLNFADVFARRKAQAQSADTNAELVPGLGSKVTFAFEAHAGPVQGVACSPFARKVFLSAGTDSQLRLYNTLKPKPVLTFEPSVTYLQSVDWSPSRPLVFAAGTAEGTVHIYDLKKDRLTPVHALSVDPNGNASGLSGGGRGDIAVGCVRFNPTFPELFAASDSTGAVWVWQLSSALCDSNDVNETASLEGITETQ